GEQLWDYWQKQLQGPLPVMQFPTDYPRPTEQTYHGLTRIFNLDQKLSKQLKELAKAEGITLYTLLLSAFQVLLYRYTGQDDLLVLSPTNGRAQTAFNEIVGYFVNPIVLRARLQGN